MSLKALTRRLMKKVVMYSVDIMVEVDHDIPRRRHQVIPQVVEASSEEEACERAIIVEKTRFHEPRLIGEPTIVTVRRMEFREGW